MHLRADDKIILSQELEIGNIGLKKRQEEKEKQGNASGKSKQELSEQADMATRKKQTHRTKSRKD